MDSLDPATLANVNEKGFVPDEVRNAFFRKLRIKSENRSCFECTARNPTWISLSYGVYLCLECSGEHRRKGVHISFVRSVELDSFTPEQMLQMGVGGNAKAWEYFKGHGMGKLSDAGRTVDYNSGIAKRYKAQIEKDTHDACEKMGLNSSKGPPPPGGLEKSSSAPATDEFTDFVQEAKAGGPGAPSQLARGKSAPASAHTSGYPGASSAAAAPPKATQPQPKAAVVASKARAAPPAIHSVAVDSVVTRVVSPTSNASKVTSSSNVPKPSGFAAKQKAKEIDFDFDFDDLEKEASKPPPAPVPKASSASEPVNAPPASRAPPSATAAAAASSNESGGMMSKYGGKKGISSDDFFHEEHQESAQARMERENRYQKFAASGAISSSAFFGDGDQNESGLGRPNSGDGFDDFKSMATQGSQLARAGLSKGAELLSTYLNKGRN